MARFALAACMVALGATRSAGEGVTLITHGYNPSVSGTPTWMASMRSDISDNFLGGEQNDGTITVTGSSGSLTATCSPWNVDLSSATNGEIVIVLDWSAVADHLTTGVSAQAVAAAVIDKLVTGQNGAPALAELPIHLIGHSRGGGLVCELARLLGERGVVVDQLTPLDPHPLTTSDTQPSTPVIDTPAAIYANVVFADVYSQTNEYPKGAYLSGGYNRLWKTLSGGYYDNSFPNNTYANHRNIYLMYQGTVDLANPVSNGEGSMDATERAAWFNAYESGGDATGFTYSRIDGGGDRTSTNALVAGGDAVRAGLNADPAFGGGGSRSALTWSAAVWPNVAALDVRADGAALGFGSHTITVGTTLELRSVYLDYDSGCTVTLRLDADRNPYNSNDVATVATRTHASATGGAFAQDTAEWNTASIPVGTAGYAYAEVTDGTRTRYLYAAPELTFAAAPVTVWYVDASRPDDSGDGASWATAKRTIQAAVGAAGRNSTVWVTNGVYGEGGVVLHGQGFTNRVAITNDIMVRSVNGPEHTFIVGASDHGTNGSAAARCVWISDGWLTGFTLTNGHTQVTGDWGYYQRGGGVILYSGGTVSNCVIRGNSAAITGGGVDFHYGGTVLDCLIEDNTTTLNYGGAGASLHTGALLDRCVVRNNSSAGVGGDGGGLFFYSGGTARNCLIAGNSANDAGGGVYVRPAATNALLESCTVVTNAAARGGGVFVTDGTNLNCVIYGNAASNGSNNWQAAAGTAVFGHCDTAPLPAGAGNISADPLFADAAGGDYRLGAASPAIDAGESRDWMAGAADLDGTSRVMMGGVDIGAYEYAPTPPGYCLEFGGTNDVNIGAGASLNVGNTLTVEAWIRPTDLSTRQGVFSTRLNDAAGGFQIEVGPGNGGTKRVAVTGKSTWVAQTGDNALALNQWFHIAYVRSASGSGNQILYVNGVAQTLVTDAAYTFTNNASDKVIGSGTSGAQLFRGRIDELRVWNVARTQAQIRDDMHRELSGGESGLAAYYGFDRASGSVLPDLTANANDGTLVGGAVWTSGTFPCADAVAAADEIRGVWTARTNSLASSILSVSNAVVSGTDFRVFGHDGGALAQNTADRPSGALWRLDRVWRAEGEGTVTGKVRFDCSGLSGLIGDVANLRLFADADGTFADASVSSGAYTGGVFTVSGASLQDGAFYTLGELAPTPVVDVTNADCEVVYSVTAYTVGGTASGLVGTLSWTNAANGANGTLAAASAWQVAGIPIAMGANVITVTGTNVLGAAAQDAVTIVRTLEFGGDSPVHYVWTNSPASAWPYTNWNTAAHAIQDALVAASASDTVLVTNGVYDAGGAAAPGCSLSNRVCLTRAVALRSVNGPSATWIVGASDSGTNGPAAVRCLYVGTNDIFVSGFTLTNGHTRASGEVYTDLMGGGAHLAGGTVSNCVLTGNSASRNGGGALCTVFGGLMTHCVLRGNAAGDDGGGAYFDSGSLADCLITGNTAGNRGGGEAGDHGSLYNCTIAGNLSESASGVSALDEKAYLYNCIVWGNTSTNGGKEISEKYGPILYTCSPSLSGYTGCITNDPQFVDAAAGDYRLRAASPCIDAGSNASVSDATDLDGSPRIIGGTVDMGAYEYAPTPVVDVTNANETVAFAVATIRVGGTANGAVVGAMTWTNALNGAAGAFAAATAWEVAGIPLAVGANVITVTGTNAAGVAASDGVEIVRQPDMTPHVCVTNSSGSVAYTVETCTVGGTNDAWVVGTMTWTNVLNGANGAFAAATAWQIADIPLAIGANAITVTGTNAAGEAASGGVTVTRAGPAVTYVSPSGGNVSPYETWAHAARTIQAAVDAVDADGLVLVTNGVYEAGGAVASAGSLTNRVCLTRAITLRSVNGPAHTFIVGASDSGTNGPAAVRCVYAVSGVVVGGFTLTNGHAFAVSEEWADDEFGGGVWLDDYAVLSNCVVVGCSAGRGGGLYCDSKMFNCAVVGNMADVGGGVWLEAGAIMKNCTVAGNSASDEGGGVYGEPGDLIVGGYLYNCIVYGNTSGGTDDLNGDFQEICYSCVPDEYIGYESHNITNDPQFVDAAAGDYRLGAASPCVDAGANAYVSGETDLDGNPRVVNGTVDMGAYEYVLIPTPSVTYVSPSGGNVWPYATWADAATTIQAAVDAVATNGTVLVGDGDYEAGGAPAPGFSLSNRVCVLKALTLQSVNGPTVTRILGAADPRFGGIGSGAVRCVYLGAGATLTGFTLSGGYTLNDGHILTESCGGGLMAASGGLVSNCVVRDCTVLNNGGGLYAATGTLQVVDCTITGNHAEHGGGLAASAGAELTVEGCSVTGNACNNYGGGIFGNASATLSLRRCVLRGNAAGSGGGVYADHDGCLTAADCLFAGNTASNNGGGIYAYGDAALDNCTIAGNDADNGGGIYGDGTITLRNSILYGNAACDEIANYDPEADITLVSCCTTPDPGGSGNLSADPLFLDAGGGDYRLRSCSPCVDAGANAYVPSETDLDGNPRVVNGTVDMGAYECQGLLAVTNPPNGGVSVDALTTAYTVGGTCSASLVGDLIWTNAATGVAGALPAAASWEIPDVALAFGDNLILVGGADASGTKTEDSVLIRRTAVDPGDSPAHYVWTGSPAEAWPYTNWTTAAHTIQAAVDAATDSDTVWVTNGVYGAGETVTPGYTAMNRVCVTNPITLRSVNGPSATFIVGAADPDSEYNGCGPEAVRCLYIGADAVVSGFTLTNGHTLISGNWLRDESGGGAFLDGAGALSNCVLAGNAAYDCGGGAYLYNGGTLNSCLLSGNAADSDGGGTYLDGGGTLNGCVLSCNAAYYNGGGAYLYGGCTLNNCLLTGNSAINCGGGVYAGAGSINACTIVGNSCEANYADGVYFGGGGELNNGIVYFNGSMDLCSYEGTVRYTCSPELSGDGNITNAPLFVDRAAGDYRLQATSPCIDAGSNSDVPSGFDLDGTPRPLDGDANGSAIVDMGCYEVLNTAADSDADGMPDGWERDHGLNAAVDDADANPDGDAFNNLQEYICDTDPTDGASCFAITAISTPSTGSGQAGVSFLSSAARNYTLLGCADLASGVWTPVTGAGPRLGAGGADTLTDSNDPPQGPFYKVKVEVP